MRFEGPILQSELANLMCSVRASIGGICQYQVTCLIRSINADGPHSQMFKVCRC